MILKNNPFYYLDDPDNAGSIDPEKRLGAELDWFIDVDSDTIAGIRSSIENGEPVSTDGLSALSKLNASVYNFSLLKEPASSDTFKAILDIDEQFSALDIDEITSTINRKRNDAGLEIVQANDVLTEIDKKRDDIRHLITEELASSSQTAYADIITLLAESHSADDKRRDHVIISDTIDQYAINIRPVIEKLTEEAEKQIETIRRSEDALTVSGNVDRLIQAVKEWYRYERPLQLQTHSGEITQEISDRLESKLKELNDYLQNDKQLTDESVKVTNVIKSVFANIDVPAGASGPDKKQSFGVLSFIADFNSLRVDSNNILHFTNTSDINNYVERIRSIDQKIKSLDDKDAASKDILRKSLCGIARGTSIELYNTKRQTAYSYTIANAIANEFGDIPSLGTQLRNDANTLKSEMLKSALNSANPAFPGPSNGIDRNSAANPSGNRSNRSGKRKLILTIIGLFFALLIFSGMVFAVIQSNKHITLSDSNFEKYFKVTTNAKYNDDDTITISYSISPKDSSYSSNRYSSDTITVEIGTIISMMKTVYGEPSYTNRHKITLYKSDNYTTSGSYTFTYKLPSIYLNLYWDTKVTSCSGRLGKNAK